MAQMNLSTKQKQSHRHREHSLVGANGGGMGYTGNLGFLDANYYI